VSAAPSAAVLLFALGISVVTGVVFGIAPAWLTSHADPIEALRGANRSAAGGTRHWAQKTLVIGQAVVSLVLLSAAAMLGQSRTRSPASRGSSAPSASCWPLSASTA
jgi:H+/Cl- antiporter ClcA